MFDALAEDMAAGVRFLRAHNYIRGARIGLVGNSQAGWIIPVAAARSQPAFMILLAGPTVSVGEELFYSDFVEFSAVPLDVAYAKLPAFTGERGFDPRPVLESLDVPGLWLLGDSDRSIPTPATVAIIDDLAARGRPFARVVFRDGGHNLSGAAVWDAINRWITRTLPPALAVRLVGNAAVQITAGALTLVTDFPYRSGAFGDMTYPASALQMSGNVLTLITHRHDDHVDLEALNGLGWRAVGPQEVTRQLPPSSVVLASEAATIDAHLKIEALPTPHANVEHVSTVVEWHGRRFYFSGDTEDPATVLVLKRLDIAFVTPWIYGAVRSRAARIDAERVVIYHHKAGERCQPAPHPAKC
jgi:L-ascorbate metabolism protein UlaG (beta-lactamase superfamily)